MAVMLRWTIAVAVLCGIGVTVPITCVAESAGPDAQSALLQPISEALPAAEAQPPAVVQPQDAAQPPARDARGRIKRSAVARAQFMRMHPCPATGRHRGPCPGYVIDHIVALKRGGADRPGNMQWQTVQEAKEKDRYE